MPCVLLPCRPTRLEISRSLRSLRSALSACRASITRHAAVHSSGSTPGGGSACRHHGCCTDASVCAVASDGDGGSSDGGGSDGDSSDGSSKVGGGASAEATGGADDHEARADGNAGDVAGSGGIEAPSASEQGAAIMKRPDPSELKDFLERTKLVQFCRFAQKKPRTIDRSMLTHWLFNLRFGSRVGGCYVTDVTVPPQMTEAGPLPLPS